MTPRIIGWRTGPEERGPMGQIDEREETSEGDQLPNVCNFDPWE
jgi:hypothetical protein